MDKSKIFSFLKEPIEAIIRLKVESFILGAADKISSIVSFILSSLLFLFCFICFFFFGSIAIALFISDLAGKQYFGFMVISLVYLFICLLLFLFRKKLFKKSLKRSIIRLFNYRSE